MKIIRAILPFVMIVGESFCTDLKYKRQTDMNIEAGLDDRYGSSPTARRQRPFTNDNFNSNQWPSFNHKPSSPRPERFPFNGPFAVEGKFPFAGSYQGKFPFGGNFPNQGRFPLGGSFPQQGRFPIGGPFPNQGTFPFGGSFPNQGRFPFGGQFPKDGRFPFDSSNLRFLPIYQPTTRKPFNGSTKPANNSSSLRDCLQNCPVTSEYNPVCGTDNVTYPNPGRLMCAQACGVSVSLLRSSPCPPSATFAPL